MHADHTVVAIEPDSVAGRRDPQIRHICRRNAPKFVDHRPRQPNRNPVGQFDLDRIPVRLKSHAARPALRLTALPASLNSTLNFVLGSLFLSLHGSIPNPALIA